MNSITDTEFGEVTVRRSSLAKYVRVRVGQDGRLSASLPLKAPLKLVKQLIEQSRDELRPVITEFRLRQKVREHGSKVGKSHTLHIKRAVTNTLKSRVVNQQITVYLPVTANQESPEVQKYISGVVKRALKKEAESYLPRRVKFLAEQHGFDVSTVRFNNASTRWGSCSSKGSINLNIALMQLPLELIDYVIVHELSHTRYMNHSSDFWALVEQFCPDYKQLRNQLRNHSPHI